MTDIRNEINFNEVLNKAIKVIGNKVFEISQLNIVQMGIIDTGFLLKSGSVLSLPEGVKINYSAPYAWSVEKGRLPGSMPPVEALENWVHRKLGVSNKDKRKVAWAIAMNIKKNGMQPKPFLETAILKVSDMIFRIEVSN